MGRSTSIESFDELARFEHLLTRTDPALDIEAFNSFMMRPVVQKKTKIPLSNEVKSADGSRCTVQSADCA